MKTSYPYMLDGPHGAKIMLSGSTYLSFAGCNYLGLSGHPELINAGKAAYEKCGISTGGIARHYDVSSDAMEAAETMAARFFGTQSAFYFVSGYFISMLALKALEDRFDIIFMDETAHYSIRDAVILAQTPCHTFRHCDPKDLEKQISFHLRPGQRPLIVSDGVFPTFGNLPPVDQYLIIADQYDGLIFLDEAHSVGCVGPDGRGSANHFGLTSDRIYFGGTLSKAFGGHGAVIPGSAGFVGQLQEKSTIAKGANIPAIPCAAHSAKSLEWVMEHPEIRQRLEQNVKFFKDGIRSMGFEMNKTEVPIATIDPGSEKQARHVHEGLMAAGIFPLWSRYIGAGPGGVIRFAVSAAHTREQLEYALNTLGPLV